jgi:hypothetical protein
VVAAGIIFFGGRDASFGAGINAKVTFFAKFLIYCNVTFQKSTL